ncbi:aldehyde dehydrogenase family protein [Natronomonas sp.]|uniref:aldehyde dehydrogenase family protein n=1 Tax=Natronomonas sp. TaxID=2184060 RepID=UPI0026217FF0|nr:aldehyde dehydrogenase family protein [Natronomonas sp.]
MSPLDQLDRTALLIGGDRREASDGATLTTENPATTEPLADVPAATPADVDDAVSAAREAFRAWRDTAPDERGRIVHRIATEIRDHAEELARLESTDQGKPLSQAESDIEGAAAYFEYYAGAADKLEGASIPVGPDQLDYTVREPYGVSGQITPWNYPANLFARGVAPALVAGNAVVVKPAEQTPLSSIRLAELCVSAGLPEGLLNVVTGYGDPTGQALAEHDGVDQLTFTGSVPTGKHIMRTAADSVTPVTLELGGKNPAIVFPDADLGAAAEWIATGIFTNVGQICSAADRVLVHESVREELIDRLAGVVEGYTVGPGTEDPDIGPLVSEAQHETVSEYLEVGRSEGATVRVGGEPMDRPGYFIEPTIFTGVDPTDRVAREEIFGPVLSVLSFEATDEAVSIANDVEYGLVAGVFTNDLTRAHRLTRELEAGNVYVNTWFGDTNQTPFGGYKHSGIGREKGLEALDSYLRTKNVAIDLGT